MPDQAPANLPEGEEEGYPMLIYQFMHAQVPRAVVRGLLIVPVVTIDLCELF